MIKQWNKTAILLVATLLFTFHPLLAYADQKSQSSTNVENGTDMSRNETANAFTDLEKTLWAKNAVEELVAAGIIEPTTEKKFYPEKDMTRGEFVGMLIKILKLNADFSDNFIDVQPGSKYYKEIGRAKELGIIQGESCNRFRPDDSVLRQDMMVFGVKALGVANKLRKEVSLTVLNNYEDRLVTSCYALNSSAVMVGEGLIVGWGNKLNARFNASRASAAVLLNRIMKLR